MWKALDGRPVTSGLRPPSQKDVWLAKWGIITNTLVAAVLEQRTVLETKHRKTDEERLLHGWYDNEGSRVTKTGEGE